MVPFSLLFLELNVFIYEKHLEQCLAQNKWYKIMIIIIIIVFLVKAEASSTFHIYFKTCKYSSNHTAMPYL